MNDTQASTGTTEQGGATPLASFEERSQSVFGRTTNDAPVVPSDPAGEASSSSASSPPDASAAGSEGETDPNAVARAERRKQLEALKAGERERVDAQARHRAAEQHAQRAAAAEKELAELKARMNGYVDPASLADPAKFFEIAQSHVKDPKKLGEWLRKQAENPELIAAEYAQKAVDPRIKALEDRIAQQDQALQRMAQDRQSREQEAAEHAAAVEFTSFAQEQAATSPLATRFIQAFGPDEFATLAKNTVAKLPPGSDYQHLLDEIEEKLEPFRKMFAPTPGAPQQSRALPTSNPAAAKAPTTVSNTLAQGRASVVDEERDWASLPFEERSRRAFGL